LDEPPEIPGLTLYNSTFLKPNIGRYFCETCGASVAFLDSNRKSGMVDVSFGLVDAEEGSLATSWVKWVGTVGFKGDGLERWGELVEDFEQGLSAWVESTY